MATGFTDQICSLLGEMSEARKAYEGMLFQADRVLAGEQTPMLEDQIKQFTLQDR